MNILKIAYMFGIALSLLTPLIIALIIVDNNYINYILLGAATMIPFVSLALYVLTINFEKGK